jgi:hydrogenase expression/formation protein HypC
MCLGTISRLAAVWAEDGVRVGRLADGSVVTLAFVPEAEAGDHVLVHLGIPVEVLDPGTAADALSLRDHALTDHHGGAP